MKKEVYDYFVNFENLGLPTKRSFYCLNSKSIEDFNPYKYQFCRTVSDIPCHFKMWRMPESIMAISMSKLYNEAGVLTPPIHPLLIKDKKAKYTFGQDINSIKGIEVQQRNKIESFRIIAYRNYEDKPRSKWKVINDQTLKSRFLEFMTEECLDELINLHLVHELTTQFDGHAGNDFLYKKPDSDKYEGVITIDLEETTAATIQNNQKVSFDEFLNTPSSYCTIDDNIDNFRTHPQRLEILKDLIQSGKLKKSQINVMRRALNYDLPKTIKELYSLDYRFQIKPIYETYSHLWEYNRKELQDELSL